MKKGRKHGSDEMRGGERQWRHRKGKNIGKKRQRKKRTRENELRK